MAQAQHETEIKLEIPPAAVARLKRHLRGHPRLKQPPQENDLVSTYFDTRQQRLRRKGFSLRVRDSGGRRVQTIKQTDNGSAGLFNRAEWEQTIEGHSPDWKAAKGTALAPLVKKKLRGGAKPIFETRVRRTSYRLHERGGELKLAFDEGSINAGDRSAPVAEIELEVENGQPAAAFAFAAAWAGSRRCCSRQRARPSAAMISLPTNPHMRSSPHQCR